MVLIWWVEGAGFAAQMGVTCLCNAVVPRRRINGRPEMQPSEIWRSVGYWGYYHSGYFFICG